MCDFCPDSTLQRRCDSISCPCTCPGSDEPREMLANGTCPCTCMCNDESERELDSAGECPCECTCNNCEQSNLNRLGCNCPRDVCPRCVDGSNGRWTDCKCECDVACGYNSACAMGRQGPQCTQPHSRVGCNGNGILEVVPNSCMSRCDCFVGWTGTYFRSPLPHPV